MLYHVRVLEELGETSEALSLLDVSSKSRAIVDRTAIMEFRGLSIRRNIVSDTYNAQLDCSQSLVQLKRLSMHGALLSNRMEIIMDISGVFSRIRVST